MLMIFILSVVDLISGSGVSLILSFQKVEGMKLLRLWFCFLLHSILFLISKTSYRTYKIISAMSSLAP